YRPETSNMPFHYRLLGKDRMALYSFIHSLNTSFGTSIFEPVAIALTKEKFKNAVKQASVGHQISEEAHIVIQKILDGLTTGREEPNKRKEIEMIRAVCRSGKMNDVKPVKADIFLEDYDGNKYLFDIKTAKPNIGNFKEFKRSLLEWVAIVLAQNPVTKVMTAIAIPYNPYEPKPYERWTVKGMLDLDEELFVADEFWDFLGGVGVFNKILDCFERAGIELRTEIDQYFEKFK
ncbi:MAG: TdeIII family type II restriction endonuclease, partial [Candidatus Neomarinimicrobiota bacterium]